MNYRQKLQTLIQKEERRQRDTISLIPSENIASKAVRAALGSVLTNKYSEGYPGKRYYGGNEIVDEVEILAQDLAQKVFKLGKYWHVNVQPYSGSPANLAVYAALLKPGEKLMGMALPAGGHLTHGWKVSLSGQWWRAVPYGVGSDGWLDYRAIERIARREKPKLIIAGATAYPRQLDFKKFQKIAREVGAYFMVDMAHIAGLVAGGAHPSPFPYADIVTTTTHKTLRGPRGAIIFANTRSIIARKRKVDIASAIDRAVFPGLQGGPHNHQTAAIAVALAEVLEPSFKRYSRQVVRSARLLARELKKQGFSLVTGGTDNHLLLLDLRPLALSGREAEDRLGKIGLIVNRNTIPNDPRPPYDPSGLRLGTPSVTTRGMKEGEMKIIARLIDETVREKRPVRELTREVRSLAKKFVFNG